MTIPRASLPSLRAFLGAIGVSKTTTTTPIRRLHSLQGGLTQNDTDVRDVVNAAVAIVDGAAGAPNITEVFSNVAATSQGGASFDVTAWAGNFTASGGKCRIDVFLSAIGNIDAQSGPVTFSVKVGGVAFGTSRTIDMQELDLPRIPISFFAIGTPASAGLKAVTVHIANAGYHGGNMVDSRDHCTITVTDFGV